MARGAVSVPLVRRRLTRGGLYKAVAGAALLLVVTALAGLCIGPELISPWRIISTLLAGDTGSAGSTILLQLRLPRLILAASVGSALATAGVIFQALLRNPLAEPYILGVSNGCSVGAIAGFMLGVGPFLQPVMSFIGGGIVILAVLMISRGSYGARSESMLLGGVMVGAIGAAFIFLMLHFLGPQLRSAIQWMMGDLSTASADIGYGSLVLLLLLFAGSFVAGDPLNALSLGDEEAASLGVNVTAARLVAYITGSFIVGVSVAFCGAIGFVGLVVPHIIRRLFGPDHRALLPLSVLGGAIFLVVCDTLARSLMPAIDSSATELPVGAVTALIGAPMFIYLLRRSREE